MSDKTKTQYTNRLSLHITAATSDRLDQIALLRDEAKAEIVRAALRAYLDEQEDLLSSRKHFTRMFQRRIDYVERLLAIVLWLNIQMAQILYERVKREPYELADLMRDAIVAGVETEDGIHTLVARASQQKTKPPAT
jgi:predicted DNA-binding protein